MPAGVYRLTAAAAHRRQGVVVVAAGPHRSAAGEQGQVGAGSSGGGRSAERRHRNHEQVRPEPAQLLVVESEPASLPGGSAFEQHVGVGEQRQQALPARRRVEVEGDAALAGVVVPQPEAALRVGHVVHERRIAAGRDAAAAARPG